jgi:hypothetical protein
MTRPLTRPADLRERRGLWLVFTVWASVIVVLASLGWVLT